MILSVLAKLSPVKLIRYIPEDKSLRFKVESPASSIEVEINLPLKSVIETFAISGREIVIIPLVGFG